MKLVLLSRGGNASPNTYVHICDMVNEDYAKSMSSHSWVSSPPISNMWPVIQKQYNVISTMRVRYFNAMHVRAQILT